MLARKLKLIYPDIDLLKDVILQDDGDDRGAYIKEWKYGAGKQPTTAELAAVDTTKAEANALAVKNRRLAYPAIGDQLDIILKQFKDLADSKALTLNKSLMDLVNKHQAIKTRYPKR